MHVIDIKEITLIAPSFPEYLFGFFFRVNIHAHTVCIDPAFTGFGAPPAVLTKSQ
jgi:hypothetical protein